MAAPSPLPLPLGGASCVDLPTDVLCLVFARLALRPRLIVLARVCRRWRTAVYLSVTAIEPPFSYRGPMDRYPNLTACHFAGSEAVPSSWREEQRSRIRSVRFHLSTSAVLRGARFTGLTRLEALVMDHDAEALSEVVAASAHSLVRLKLSCKRKGFPAPDVRLPAGLTTAMPALRSVAFFGQFKDTMEHFSPRLSQLTSVSSFSWPRSTEHYAMHLPNVRRLSIVIKPSEDSLAWLATLPSLTALKLRSCVSSDSQADLTRFITSVAPVLTSVTTDTDRGTALLMCSTST